MVNLYRLLVGLGILLALASGQRADAKPKVKPTNLAHMLNSAKTLLEFDDTVAVLEAGAQASGKRALQREVANCRFGSKIDRKTCYNLGLIPLFTKKKLDVRPRRAARVLKRACMSAVTWKGEAECFHWELLTIKGPRIMKRTKSCNFMFNSTKREKAQCYRQALKNL